MAKTSKDALLEDIAGDFHTYLRKGVRFERVVGAAHPDLDIDDIETLLRIHFVLTDAEGEPDSVGVLDFMRWLEDRIRRMKTTTTPRTTERRGGIRGHVDWQQTIKKRSRAGRLDEPLFVCNQPEEHYNIDENLVLKRLLSIIYDIVFEDLARALENPDGYEWLDEWVKSEASDGRQDAESAAELLRRVYEQNIYLQRIEGVESQLDSRTIESVKRSRSAFYREAAMLLDRYRQLMDRELDGDEARDILDNTIIAPEKADVLFELYWIFRILESYDAAQYRVLTDWRDDSSTISTWEEAGARYVMSHDSIGSALSFNESIGDAEVEPDGYLYRMNEVMTRWQSLSKELFDRGASNSLWGGRPDIVLERFVEGESSEWALDQVFIGEVKYTRDAGYVATGLRELLEYMAFVRHRRKSENSEGYVEKPENLLESVSVKGMLFVDRLEQETGSDDQIEIVQYGESLSSGL